MTYLQYIQTHLRAYPPSALPLLLGAAAVTLLLALVAGELAMIGLFVVILMLVVYGDPGRAVPMADGMVVAPADAMITALEQHTGLPLIFEQANDQIEHFTRLTMRQRVFGGRTLRAPITGTVVEIVGSTSIGTAADDAAALPLWQRYAEMSVLLRDPSGQEYALAVRAPLVPNQIWMTITTGQTVQAGDRIGLIALIGVVDLYLPDQKIMYKASGQRTVAGETVIAVASGPAPVFRTI